MNSLSDFDHLPVTPLHRKITFCAGGGSFIDAYVLIIIGVALENLVSDFNLDSFWVGVITASTFVGLAVGTFLFGFIGDRIGRKRIFIFNIIGLAVCSVLSAFVSTPFELVMARFFMGLLIGGDYPIATSMVAEFAPIKNRAWAMGSIAAIWFVGGIVASLVGYFLHDWDNGWRWMLASAVVPCLFVFSGRLSVPESPRWLLEKGRTAEAARVFARFGLAMPRRELNRYTPERPSAPSIATVFHGENLEHLLFVAMIWVCQVVPMFALYMFGPRIMQSIGVVGAGDAMIANTLISVAFFIGCFPAMWSITRFGRRVVCVSCFALMTLSFAVLLLFEDNVAVALVCLVAYALASGGPGTLQWLYPNELFPTEIRATAVGCAMSLTRIVTILSTFFLYPVLTEQGSHSILVSALVISLAGLLTSYFFAPETKGISLSEAHYAH